MATKQAERDASGPTMAFQGSLTAKNKDDLMEIITVLVILMEAGKKFKKEELIGIIQTHLNAHPLLKDNSCFTGLFGSHCDKENLPWCVANANVSSVQHRQHQSGSTIAPSESMAMSQPFSPSHVNFTMPGPHASTSSHPFNQLPHHSLPEHYSHHNYSYNSPPSQAQAAQYPSFQDQVINNTNGTNAF